MDDEVIADIIEDIAEGDYGDAIGDLLDALDDE